MKNNSFLNINIKFSYAKFIFFAAVIGFVGFTAIYRQLPVFAQIQSETSSEKDFTEPEFFKNSGSVDTSFQANLLNDSNNSTVNVTELLQQPDGKLLIAGDFRNVNGVSKRVLVRLNQDFSVDNSFNTEITGGSITALALQPNGKILIGGFLNTSININRSGLFRLNPDGSFDSSFEVGAGNDNLSIQTIIVLANGRILITGNFGNIGNITLPGIAILQPDGNLDTSFDPGNITGTNGSQRLVAEAAIQPDGKILIAGSFSNINGVVRNRLARLESSGQLDLSFDPGIGPNEQVNEIIPLANGKILIGGNFTSINGIVQNKIARLNADGSLDRTFNSTVQGNFTVNALVVQPDGKIIAGADFSFSSSNNLSPVFRLNADGSLDTSFNLPNGTNNSNFTNRVNDLLLQSDGKVIIGGSFRFISDVARTSIARLNSDGTLDTSFNILLGVDGTVRIIAVQPDGKIIIYGEFSFVDGVMRNRFARLNRDGSLDTSFNPALTPSRFGNSLSDILIQPDGKILVGGNFTNSDGSTFNGIFRLNTDGSLDNSFSVAVSGSIFGFALQPNGQIVIGGNFNRVNNVVRNSVARLNADGSLDTAFDSGSGASGAINRIAVQSDGKLIIVGGFSRYNDAPRQGIARLNADGSLDATFNADLGNNGNSSPALAIQSDGKILIGGGFLQVNGVNRSVLARLNTDGSLDTNFGFTTGQGGNVNAISLQPNGKIIAAGNFNGIFGSVRRNIVRLNPDGSIDPVFTPNIGFGGGIQALARQTNGKILIGGDFTIVDGVFRAGIARLRTNDCVVSPLFDFNNDGKTELSIYRPQEGAWYIRNADNGGFSRQLFGLSTDLIVPGDYDADETTDLAVFRPSNGIWYILNSRIGFRAFQFGTNGDKPIAADFDGDGRDDLAVFRPSSGTWFIRRSSLGITTVRFGSAEDIPVIADMDGDCQADIALFRPSNGAWYWLRSSDGNFRAVQFGTTGDTPAAGDYDGDGITDLAVFRPSNSTWYILNTRTGFAALQFGNSTDKPVPADYDGDGVTDIAVFRNGVWFILQSLNGKVVNIQFGQEGDQPIPSAYLPR